MSASRTGLSRRDVIGSAAGLAAGVVAQGQGVPEAAAAEAPRGTMTGGPAKVMIIRHAEKPRAGRPPYGVGPDGREDVNALLVEGWQRAGALIGLFAPRTGAPADPAIARPTFLYAAAATSAHPSRRAMLTLGPIAALTSLSPVTTFGPDDEAAAAASILAQTGIGLVAWEHKRIGDLVRAVTGGTVTPPHWPGKRYDMVLVLDRQGERGWKMTQVPQRLLAGDRSEPLGFAAAGTEDD